MHAVTPAPLEPLLTARQVAGLLSVSQHWVLQHALGRRRPVLPSVKLGKFVRFRASQLAQWLKEMERAA